MHRDRDVLIPGLTISKTASASTATPGSAVGYTITVADTGQTSYTGATVTDSLGGVLNDASYNGDAAATIGSVSYTEPVLTWTGSLTPGQTAKITYSVTVTNPDIGSRVLTNSAVSAAAGSNCPAASADRAAPPRSASCPASSASRCQSAPSSAAPTRVARSAPGWAPSRSPTTAVSAPIGP